MNRQFLMIGAATLIGSVSGVIAGPIDGMASTTPAAVCYDELGNTRYIRATESCKAGESKAKILPNPPPADPGEDPAAAVQKQIADLVAKVSALQAEVTKAKADQAKSDKGDKSDSSSGSDSGFIDMKTRKQIESVVKELQAQEGDSSLPDNQMHPMAGQKSGAAKNPSNATTAVAMQRVKAPFEVIDSRGNVILRVAEDAEAARGARSTLGPSSSSKYGLRIFNQGGMLVAGVGHGADGGGLVTVSDGQFPVASMSATDRAVSVFKKNLAAASLKTSGDGGEVTVYNNSGAPVGHMSVNGANGGAVVIARSDGFGIFGAQDEGNGGGSACVNRISSEGVPSKTCLGIGLPLR